ncbi:MAG: hypothetical protein Q8L48_28555 [Archangium sp.]|nr:hypothetical protein [Archangium sp.]
MFDQGFQILKRTELDAELSNLFRRWDAAPQERAEFVGWAWVVAASADFSAMENRAIASELLRSERDLIHAKLTEKLHSTSSIDLHLVSRRMFLDWLAGELLRERVAA